ncbi:MAG: alkaline shock response membrane anchor protein AmaP [Candidatus Omnitrophota bacterium]|nr:MAG: alkaline shock response membrane anchor protein AmaP [Candidatus Omnitrophota bacterium]
MGLLIAFIYVITSIVAGAVLVGLSLNLFNLQIIFDYLQNQLPSSGTSRITMGLSGLLILLLCLKYIRMSMARGQEAKAVTFESPQGKASITLSALEEMLKKTLEEKEEISHVRPRVVLTKKGIAVLIKSNLTKELNILEVTNATQGLIKEKLVSFLGKDKDIRVKLEIQKVMLEKKAKEESKEEEEEVEGEEPEIPFRNY